MSEAPAEEEGAPVPEPDAEEPSEPAPGRTSAPAPRSRWSLRADYTPPAPFERVARGVALALLLPLAHLPFLVGERGQNLLAFTFFALLVGLLATPASYAEAWLAKRSLRVRLAALVWLPTLLAGGAVLVVAQVIFTLRLTKGGSREAALGEALRFLRRLGGDFDKIAGFLLPLALALTFHCVARVFAIRWRWAFLAVPVLTLIVSLVLHAATGHVGSRSGIWISLAVTLAACYPLAAVAAARLQRRREASWDG